MAWVIVGLGNPGEAYSHTRHNTGRDAVALFAQTHGIDAWKNDQKAHATVANGIAVKNTVVLVAPDTFMNKSGSAVAKFVKTPKVAERMIVVYDDLDLPLGTIKLSFDRGSGGHKGLESVVRAVKTKRFARVRIGMSPTTANGALKKPSGEKEVNAFILAKFSPTESEVLKRMFKKVSAAIDSIIEKGVVAAMNEFN